jgi:hypothetical protein
MPRSVTFNFKPFTVQTSVGLISLWARDRTHAISTAQELVGRDKRVTRCQQDGDW